jgi:hypothetical protein
MHPRVKSFSIRHHRAYGAIWTGIGLSCLSAGGWSASFSNVSILFPGFLICAGLLVVATGLIYFFVPPDKMFVWMDPPVLTNRWLLSATAISLSLLGVSIFLAIMIRDRYDAQGQNRQAEQVETQQPPLAALSSTSPVS